ncbi:MAG: PASTA domain-containing protein [Ruminococcaceae bacterium]|nr:PASTA domain-containing protein [Oscillospiraceae bacterium]
MIYSQSWRRSLLNKKCAFVFFVFLLAAAYLVYVLADLQIINYDKYQNSAIDQFTRTVTIEAKRGTIYDRNMNALAVSATAERIFISPNTIPQMTVGEFIEEKVSNTAEERQAEVRAKLNSVFEDKTITVSEDLSKLLSSLLDVDEEAVLAKAKKLKRADETIKNKVELDDANAVRAAVNERYYSSFVHFAEQSKRYYPYGTLAAHVIGFTGTDNKGLAGVEAYYNTELSGTNGKIVTAKDGVGNTLDMNYEEYVSAMNGTDIMLTLDWTLQSILEKHLVTAQQETQAQNRVAGIIMDVNNGEILAQATKNDFDLNSPFTLDDNSQAVLDTFLGTEEQIAQKRSSLLYELWKDKIITELYEPGSTFKIITSSIVLEEDLVDDDDTFFCSGSIKISGYDTPIHCARRAGHGLLSFAQALQQSCNPAFVTLSKRVGNDLFYKYYKAFGYTNKTNVDLPGVASNYFFNLSTFGPVDLAAASFGQNFKVTPISHLSAIAAVANGGYLVTPHVLKATLDTEGNILNEYELPETRQVISKETATEICSILEEGVITGGSKNAAVMGYSVAAKTGTSVKTELKTETETKYVASCVAFAPANDPQIAVLIMIDEPIGSYYGGTIAAPVVSKVLAEALPYLGIEPKYSEEEIEQKTNILPDYRQNSVSVAVNDLKNKKLTYKIIGDGDKVTNQVPAHGTSLMANGTVVLYTNNIAPEETVRVPNVIGLTAAAANKELTNAGLNIAIVDSTFDKLEGAIAIKQSIDSNEKVVPGTVISVEFRHYNGIE